MSEEMHQDTHAKLILEHMIKFGSITPGDALAEYGCMRLAARIADIRADGIEVETEMVKAKNRFGKTVKYARYYLKREDQSKDGREAQS